jgi:hypothetical protein
MTRENPTWGQERMANEPWLKLGLRVSPRTVRQYMPKRLDRGPSQRMQSQLWSTAATASRSDSVGPHVSLPVSFNQVVMAISRALLHSPPGQ